MRKFLPSLGQFGPAGYKRTDFNAAAGVAVNKGTPYYMNGYFIVNKGAMDESRKAAFCKRPGLIEATHISGTPFSGLTGTFTNNYSFQGVVAAANKTAFIAYQNTGAAKTSFHWDGTTKTTNAPPAAFTNSGPVVFELLDGISYGANAYYAATDFSAGAVLDATGAWTQITDVDFTGLTKVTNFKAMNGYLFIGTSNNRIYNSDLNAATSWNALGYVTAAEVPGAIVWLEKVRNYLVCFKQNSIEFFEDVGRPSPGSPLEPQKQLTRRIGCAAKSSVQVVSDGILFLGISTKGKVGVYKIFEDTLDVKEVSDEYVQAACSVFQGIDSSYSVDAKTGGATSHGESQVIMYQDKEFYAINLNMTTSYNSGGVRRTFIYDNELNLWTIWASQLTGSLQDNSFEPGQAIIHKKGNVLYNVFFNNFSVAAGTPAILNVISSSVDFWQDYGDATTARSYNYEWGTDIFSFGSNGRKFMDRLEVVYDCDPAATPSTSNSSTFTLTINDTDFNIGQAFTAPAHSATKSIVYDAGMFKKAVATQLGSFYTRTFDILICDANPWRLWGLWLTMDFGDIDTVNAENQ